MVIVALGKPATVSFRLVAFSTAWHSLIIQYNEYTEVSGLNNNIVMTTAFTNENIYFENYNDEQRKFINES
jgi:hypothetical protein